MFVYCYCNCYCLLLRFNYTECCNETSTPVSLYIFSRPPGQKCIAKTRLSLDAFIENKYNERKAEITINTEGDLTTGHQKKCSDPVCFKFMPRNSIKIYHLFTTSFLHIYAKLSNFGLLVLFETLIV